MKNTIRTVALLSVLCLATAVCQQEPNIVFQSLTASVKAKLQREVVTYTTRDRADAYSWAATMNRNGYNVTINFNPSTGIFTCTATR
jgi:hypothetical protein